MHALLQLNELVTSEENAFPQFVESILKMTEDAPDSQPAPEGQAIAEEPLTGLASINQCLSKESLRQLDRKLVRFDCQICDMFEEEYFVPVVPAKQQGEASDASQASCTTGNPLVYKYFSEMSDADMALYETGYAQGGNPIERGNILASSLIHMQGWTGP